MMATAVQQKVKVPAEECIVNDAPRTFTEADLTVGSIGRQGDLYLVRIAALPASAKPRRNRQLADGNTQGSRHVLERGEAFDCAPAAVVAAIKIVCPKASVAESYVGPVFRTVNGAALLTHPEHGDHGYVGDMVVAVVFQRSLDAELREQRVRD